MKKKKTMGKSFTFTIFCPKMFNKAVDSALVRNDKFISRHCFVINNTRELDCIYELVLLKQKNNDLPWVFK